MNAPIRYIYPSGYQNMRPRSGPWKISLIICMLFTWLTVFIVGHCSDKAEQTYYNVVIDDDLLVIETRWCGSQLLYFMWLMSIIITGLATAYCSIIGYIKARDFAVANCRSQPPGMVGKSDYYVRIEDGPIQHLHRPYMDKRLITLQLISRVDPFKKVFIKQMERLNFGVVTYIDLRKQLLLSLVDNNIFLKNNKQIMPSLTMKYIFDCLHY